MSPTEALFAQYGPSYRWLATGAAMIAAISVILSATIVNVAIPAVMGAFGIDQTKAQWLSTGFLAAMTTTMLLTHWAEQALGQRGTITGALVLFIAGSVLGGIAPNEDVLIAARVIQGAAAGIVQPMAMIIIFQVFPPERRGAAMGVFGIGVVLAPALGPWVGGLLMDSFDWRYVFYLGLPFAALGGVLANVFLPGREASGPRPGFDWLGLALVTVSLTALLSAFAGGQRAGWSSPDSSPGSGALHTRCSTCASSGICRSPPLRSSASCSEQASSARLTYCRYSCRRSKASRPPRPGCC
jgi:MFS transporter, DHA2 family, multidrug resistance protein